MVKNNTMESEKEIKGDIINSLRGKKSTESFLFGDDSNEKKDKNKDGQFYWRRLK